VPAAVPEEEARLLAAADRPYKHLRGAFLALIALLVLGIVLIVLAHYDRLNPTISLGTFMVIAGATVGGILGILLGDLLTLPSILARSIAVLIAALIGYLSSAVVSKVASKEVQTFVDEELPRMLGSAAQPADPFIVKLVVVLSVFALAFGFLLGFFHAARPKD